ncbi:MAG: ribonuclease Z [Lachnospira sp.]|nr:ribonuclease Z [Lachnospira sp.]
MLDVCLLGTSGMLPLPGRWLTSLMLRCNGHSLLIDCGEGTQIAIREKGWSFHDIDGICLTHYHADHVAGLPGILLTIGNADRTEPVTIIGPKGLKKIVASLRVIAPELPFPVILQELEEPEEHLKLGEFAIDAFHVQHRVTCYGYSVRIPRAGKFDAARALASGIPQKYWNRLQHGENVTDTDGGRLLTPDMVLGQERRGLKVTYCTDSRPVPVIAQMAQDADLFICEGMYGETEKTAKAKEYRHMTFTEAAQLGKQAAPRRMWLTHYSPSLVKPGRYIQAARDIFPPVECGRDGMTLTLAFDDE